MATPGATRSGLTESSNARPVDENGATRAGAGLASASAPRELTVTAPPVSSVAAAAAPCSPGDHDDRERHAVVEAERAGGRAAVAVEHERAGARRAGGGRALRDRRAVARQQHGLALDEARAVGREEVALGRPGAMSAGARAVSDIGRAGGQHERPAATPSPGLSAPASGTSFSVLSTPSA